MNKIKSREWLLWDEVRERLREIGDVDMYDLWQAHDQNRVHALLGCAKEVEMHAQYLRELAVRLCQIDELKEDLKDERNRQIER